MKTPDQPGTWISLEDLDQLQAFLNRCTAPAGSTCQEAAVMVVALNRWREQARSEWAEHQERRRLARQKARDRRRAQVQTSTPVEALDG